MIQRLLTLILLCCLPLTVTAETATPKAAAPKVPATVIKPQKSAEERYLAGQACLQQEDVPCAQVELASIAPGSPYAKLLEAEIAASAQDDETVLRLLLPLKSIGLKTNSSLLPQAMTSLHATLAQAYENQGNVLRAIEQLNLSAPENPESIQTHIWQLLKDQPRASLLELRGESQDTLSQGWIDLALAANGKTPTSAITQWRNAYPDHPVSDTFLLQLAQTAPVIVEQDSFTGTVALLLPLNEPAYANAAAALKAGLMAAHGDSAAIVKIYASRGDKAEIAALYQQAINEGAQYVVGPMARDEVSALAAAGLKLVPTLALNSTDQETLPENLMAFGLPVEAEAEQVAEVARAHGMQSAILISADTPLANRAEQAFAKEWQAQQGTIVIQKTFSADSSLVELKADLSARGADMIFLAANAEQAKMVRPYLDPSIPTFAISHVYDGVALNPDNTALMAIHFVDMPWMVNADHPDFAAYRKAAESLPPGESQRWFAVGVDAWHILAAIAAGKSILIPGLSGTLHMEGKTLVRDLPMAQFGPTGVALEPAR